MTIGEGWLNFLQRNKIKNTYSTFILRFSHAFYLPTTEKGTRMTRISYQKISFSSQLCDALRFFANLCGITITFYNLGDT